MERAAGESDAAGSDDHEHEVELSPFLPSDNAQLAAGGGHEPLVELESAAPVGAPAMALHSPLAGSGSSWSSTHTGSELSELHGSTAQITALFSAAVRRQLRAIDGATEAPCPEPPRDASNLPTPGSVDTASLPSRGRWSQLPVDSDAPSDVSIDTRAAEAILDGSNYFDVLRSTQSADSVARATRDV